MIQLPKRPPRLPSSSLGTLNSMDKILEHMYRIGKFVGEIDSLLKLRSYEYALNYMDFLWGELKELEKTLGKEPGEFIDYIRPTWDVIRNAIKEKHVNVRDITDDLDFVLEKIRNYVVGELYEAVRIWGVRRV